MRLKDSPAGFTLVELMASIIILTILAVLILSGIKNVQSSARSAACISNLRSLGVGFASYASENDGLFPTSSTGGPWPEKIAAYVPRKNFFCPEAVALEKTQSVVTSINTDKTWSDSMTRVSYGYNYRYLDPEFGSGWTIPRPREQITFLSLSRMGSVVVLADAGRLNTEKTGGWGFYVMEPPHLQYSMPLPRHSKHANVLWADGHVSQRKCILTPKNATESYEYISQKEWDWRLQ